MLFLSLYFLVLLDTINMSFRFFMNDGIIHIISALLLPNDVFTHISIAVLNRSNKMKYKENHTVRTIPTSI